jgi:hypothetical protein
VRRPSLEARLMRLEGGGEQPSADSAELEALRAKNAELEARVAALGDHGARAPGRRAPEVTARSAVLRLVWLMKCEDWIVPAQAAIVGCRREVNMMARVALLGTLLCACAGGTPEVAGSSQEIVNGQLDNGAHPYVGWIPGCTATVIGSHTILTAAHCVQSGDVTSPRGGFYLVDLSAPPDPDKTYRVTRTIENPFYYDAGGQVIDSYHDIAVGVLDRSVTGVSPVGVARELPLIGTNITFVGVGAVAYGEPPGDFGTKRYGTNVITATAQDPSGMTPGVSFDIGPVGGANAQICDGDSGGPSFVTGGPALIIGVNNSTSQCAAFGRMVSAPAWRHWIGEQMLGDTIRVRYDGLSPAAQGALGDGITDEALDSCGGSYNDFDNGSIVSSSAGAFIIQGGIRAEWRAIGSGCSAVGFPTSDEGNTNCLDAQGNLGRTNGFQTGSILWSPVTGAHEVHGAIRAEWQALGSECSVLGFPTSDETNTSCGGGRYNNFEHGAITWMPDTGAHYTSGAIRQAWAARSYECGCLGFPTDDPTPFGSADQGGVLQHFQHGSITFRNATGIATATCSGICAGVADGVYCGDSTSGFPGTGDPSTLYACHGGALQSTTPCAYDCFIQPPGYPDTCDACAFALDGVYCGYSTMDHFPGTGVVKDRYFCQAHATTQIEYCAAGCSINPRGADYCNTCPGPVCGTNCCAAGAWCGTGNRCCTSCGPGCNC